MKQSDFENWVKLMLSSTGEVTCAQAQEFFDISRITFARSLSLQTQESLGCKWDASKKAYISTKEQYVPDIAAVLDSLLVQYKSKSKNLDWLEDKSDEMGHMSNSFLFPDLVQSINQKQVVQMEYLSRQKKSIKTFSIHRIVKTNSRYHIRGYCHNTHKFEDLSLNRILDIQLASDNQYSYVKASEDLQWTQEVWIKFKISQHLNEHEKDVVRQNYHIKPDQNFYVKKSTKAMQWYAMQEVGARSINDKKIFDDKPEVTQDIETEKPKKNTLSIK